MNEILSFPELQQITGYTRGGDIAKCLSQQGVRVFWGREGVFTTLHHLNHPHNGSKKEDSTGKLEF